MILVQIALHSVYSLCDQALKGRELGERKGEARESLSATPAFFGKTHSRILNYPGQSQQSRDRSYQFDIQCKPHKFSFSQIQSAKLPLSLFWLPSSTELFFQGLFKRTNRLIFMYCSAV